MASRTGTRRGFFETLGQTGTAAALGALALRPESARGYAANDTLQVGCIGTGGRCRTLMKSLAGLPGVRITAVCDVYDKHRDAGKALADPKAFATGHFPELLARKDVDAVLIGSPDHWHVPMTVAACDAGKDVYVEKPLTHDPTEGPAVVAAQDRHRRVVQVGTQQRSMPHMKEARDLVVAGKIGRVFKVQTQWNRNTTSRFRRTPMGVDPKGVDWKAFLGHAPDQPFDEYRFRNWRWFWDFGGGLLTDLMVHWVDVAHWFLGLDKPTGAVTAGFHFASEGVWQTPDTIQCVLTYPGDVQIHFEGTFSNARRGAMIEFMGTEATLYLDRGAAILTPERGRGGAQEWNPSGVAERGRDFYDHPDGERLHLANWVDCTRSRHRPHCPAGAGVGAAAAAQLGNLAYRNGGAARAES